MDLVLERTVLDQAQRLIPQTKACIVKLGEMLAAYGLVRPSWRRAPLQLAILEHLGC